MRRLLERVLLSLYKTNAPDNFPSLPADQSLFEIRQRATIGYLAFRCAKKLGFDNPDALFYHSFTKGSFEIPSSVVQNDLPLHLAHLIVKLIQDGDKLSTNLKQFKLSPEFESCLIETFTEYREQIIRDFMLPGTFKNESVEETNLQISSPKQVQTEPSELKEWQIYRDVMYAVTQKKFLLISKNEIQNYTSGSIICEGTIIERSDIPRCRQLAQEALHKLGFELKDVMGWLLMISEAITNILKHAEKGKMQLIENDGVIRVVIEDKGPGFSLKDLPKTTLMAGYSTKKSLGQGFTLMLKMTEQVLLYTYSEGSTLILTLNKKESD